MLPPAPAPGGVPLRPLAVGDILSGAFTLIRRNPVIILGLAAIVMTLSGIITTFISWNELKLAHQLTSSVVSQAGSPAIFHAEGQFYGSSAPFFVLTYALGFLFGSVLTSLLAAPLAQSLLGGTITFGAAWRAARLPAVLGYAAIVLLLMPVLFAPVTILVVLLALAHLTLAAVLVGIAGYPGTLVVAILVYIRLNLTVPVIVLEAAGPITAMKRSWQLVRSSWWRIFGISLLTVLVTGVVASVLAFPFQILSGLLPGGGLRSLFDPAAAGSPSLLAAAIGAVGTIIASTCTRPVKSGVKVLLYADMRIRREGLDLVLQQAGQPQAAAGQDLLGIWRPGAFAQDPFPGARPGAGAAPGPGANAAAARGAGPGPTQAW